MTKRTYKVVGPRNVAGTFPGNSVQLDDEKVSVQALIESGHVELVIERKAPAKESAVEKKPEEVAV